ncbi:MAG: cell envelope integrity protein TolA [Pseudomonadota bacterium]
MKHAAIVSLVIHAIVFILILIGIGDPFNHLIKDNQPMIIDFVNVAETSAAPKLSAVNQKKQDTVKPPEETKPQETTPPPTEEKKVLEETKAKPEAKPEPKPEPKKEEPKIDPDAAHILKKDPKKDEPKKEDKKEDKKKDLIKPKTEKPKDTQKDQKKAKKSDDKALINLNKAKESDKNKKADPKAKTAAKAMDDLLNKLVDEEGSDEQGAPADSIGAALTANEIDAVRQTIRKCWTFHAGSQGAKDIVVDIQMELAPDGTVIEAEIMDKDRMAKDPAFRTAAESAKRAVLDPNCSPLPLPPKKYEQWKTSAFRFNPKDM